MFLFLIVCFVWRYVGIKCNIIHGLFHRMLLFFKCAVPGIPNLNLPDVCTSTPAYASAFCREHCELLNREAPAIKTNLKEFLQHCNTTTDEGT